MHSLALLSLLNLALATNNLFLNSKDCSLGFLTSLKHYFELVKIRYRREQLNTYRKKVLPRYDHKFQGTRNR